MEEVSHLIIKVTSDSVATADGRLIVLTKTAKGAEKATDGLTAAFKRLVTIAAAVAIFKQGAGYIAEFEASMSEVKAITQATGDEFEKLSIVARKLGADTQYSANQAADGMKFLGQAGFSTNQIIAAMPGLLDLATVGHLELGRAADIASNILQGFRMRAEESGRAADVLATAAIESNTNVEQIGEGMKYVAAIAATMGQTFEETTAAIGALSNAGIQASMAGTGLRQIMSELANPTREARDVLEAYGVKLDEVNPSIHSISEIIERLAKVSLTASDALTIAGDRGGNALLALTSNTKEVARLNDELAKSGGRAKETARVMNDNLKGDVLQLKSAVEELALRFGDAGLTDGMRKATKWATDFVKSLYGIEVAVVGVENWIDLLRSKLGLLTDGFYDAMENIKLTNALMKDAGVHDWLGDALKNIPENIRAASQLFGAFAGKWILISEEIRAGVVEEFSLMWKFLVDSVKITGREIYEQMKRPFVELLLFIRETQIKVAETLNKFLPKDNQYTEANFFGVLREDVAKYKAEIADLKNDYWKGQAAALKQFGDASKTNISEALKQIHRIDEAYEEEVTRILDERDVNIASSEEKIKKIKELRAAYLAAAEARRKASEENAPKSGGVVTKSSTEAPSNDHFMVREFEQLKKQLQLEEKTILESYRKRIELIRRNTKEGSDVRAELEQAANAELSSDLEQAWQKRQDRILELDQQIYDAIREGRSTDAEALQGHLAYEEKLQEESYRRRLELLKTDMTMSQEVRDAAARAIAALDAKRAKDDELRKKAKYNRELQLASDFFGNLATISSAFGRKGAKAAKAFAIVQATIDTYKAATGAYASLASIPYVGPVLGAAAAGAALAAGMANVQAIRSQEYAGAYEHGGMIPAGKVGLVGETGKPELVRGPALVTSARDTEDAMRREAPAGKTSIVVNNYANADVQVKERETDDGRVIELVLNKMQSKITADIDRGGPISRSLERSYAMKRGAAA